MILAAIALGLASAGTVPAAEVATEAAPAPLVDVRIVRDGPRWTADFAFGKDSPVWIFSRSALTRKGTKPWRPLSWTIETPGVELARIGYYDAFVAKDGTVPRQVRVRFTPFAEDLRADYDPALAFSDGSVALFTEHYNAIPFASAAAVEALPSFLDELDLEDSGPSRVTFEDRAGPVLHAGERHPGVTLTEGNSYVLFGEPRTLDAPAITTVLDPELPPWLTAELSDFTPKLLSLYADRLGPRGGDKPTVMVSWAGPTPGVQSLGGSVLPGLVVMRLEGEVVAKVNPIIRSSARWLIAHETAHFWAGQTVRYGSPAEAWITEGGAELLAIRAASELDPKFDSRTELQARLDECLKLARKGPISSAGERSEHNAYYACGAMFGLAAETASARRGSDFFGFWRGLIEANRADGIVNRGDWLAGFAALPGMSQSSDRIERLLDGTASDPRAELEALFKPAGVAYRRTDGAGLTLA